MRTALERVTVIRQAVDEGEALREWKTRRQFMQGELATLKADIDQGLAKIAAGRVEPFDVECIIAQGRQRLPAAPCD